MSFQCKYMILMLALALSSGSAAANPFVEWKERLFGSRPSAAEIRDAPLDGVIVLGLDHPERIRIGRDTPQRDFPQGKSRYREIELPREIGNAAIRIQVVAKDNPKGRGNIVFKPVLYVLNEDGSVRDSRPADPLYLDIRPFKPTRLLSCVSLEDVRRFALATTPDAIGKSYESKAREKLNAPTKAGFYYATDAVKVKLPYAETGEFIIELVEQDSIGSEC